MTNDLFAHKAKNYEQLPSRVTNVDNIANSIIRAVELKKSMHIMDFGSGTGLLLERIAPHVGKITAVDISASMNRQLDEKRSYLGCAIEILEVDLEQTSIEQKFDGIISSMTLHHIRDIEAIFRKFHALLNEGGFIALSDLDEEDGSFHSEDIGVFHFGFNRKQLAGIAATAGFSSVAIIDSSVVPKAQRDYPVFLLTATKS